MVSTTLVLSALVIAVLGFFLVEQISSGLLTSAETAARAQADAGRTSELGQTSVDVLEPPLNQFVAEDNAELIARTLQEQASGNYRQLPGLRSADQHPRGLLRCSGWASATSTSRRPSRRT